MYSTVAIVSLIPYSGEVPQVQLCEGGRETQEEQGSEKVSQSRLSGVQFLQHSPCPTMPHCRAKQAEQVAIRNEVRVTLQPELVRAMQDSDLTVQCSYPTGL